MTHVPHPHVRHPSEHLQPRSRKRLARGNDAVLEWLSAHLGASAATFWVALIAPLVVLPLSNSARLILGVISGSWFQWWMLPAIQRSGIKADAKRDAKADADHQALTHLAHTADRSEDALAALKAAQVELKTMLTAHGETLAALGETLAALAAAKPPVPEPAPPRIPRAKPTPGTAKRAVKEGP